MNAEIFAEWFRRRGHNVIRTASSYWYDQGPHVYQAFPYHWVITPTSGELTRMLLRHTALGLRYSTPLDAPEGSLSYHTLCRGKYDLTDLPRRARGSVRKGLRSLEVQPISFERLADEGWALRQDTLQRQGRDNDERQDWWRKLCLSAIGLPGFEAWGAVCHGKLAAALLAVSCDTCYTMLYQQSATEFLPLGPNNALAYTVTHEALKRPGIAQVFYGLESLTAADDVDTFKLRMGYEAFPLRQRVVFHPAVAPVLNSYTYRMARELAHRYPAAGMLAKLVGMLRFFQNGKLPLERQLQPAALAAGGASLAEAALAEAGQEAAA